jgi:hypothetical protein
MTKRDSGAEGKGCPRSPRPAGSAPGAGGLGFPTEPWELICGIFY